MKTESYTDKSKWTRGEWDGEPDKMSWTDNETGLACLIVRGGSGALCGYVAVERDHPFYGKEYSDVDVDIHGGLTYSDKCQEEGRVCHVPEPGKPDDVWWLGFDCAHGGDISPAYARGEFVGIDDSYKNVAYVQREVALLAQQVAATSSAFTVRYDATQEHWEALCAEYPHMIGRDSDTPVYALDAVIDLISEMAMRIDRSE